MNIQAIQEKIEAVTKAERITKQMLSELSRDLLQVQLEGGDAVQLINTLMGEVDGVFRLTPINWRIAAQYFYNFIPHASNFASEVKDFAVNGSGKRVALVFGKANKNAAKRIAKLGKAGDIEHWLSDPANDMWSWSNEIKMEAKPKDWAKELQKAFDNATDEAKGGMSVRDCMLALLDGCDVDVAEILESLNPIAHPEQQDAA